MVAGADNFLRHVQDVARLIALEKHVMAPMDYEDPKDFEKRKARRGSFAVTSGNHGRAKSMLAMAAPHCLEKQ